MKSSPKVLALAVVILEIIFCFIIYCGCACYRRRRRRQQHNQRQTSRVITDDDANISTPAAESILVFFPYSIAKALLGEAVVSLRCANCLDEFKEEDRTLRLIPKCGHVFHPMCLIDPCSAACPYCPAGLDSIGLDSNLDPEDGLANATEDDESKSEVKVKVEVEELKEKVYEKKVEENNMISLPDDLIEKIIVHAKLVLPTGKLCSPTKFLRK